jgi:hypothetical protein
MNTVLQLPHEVQTLPLAILRRRPSTVALM